MLQTQLLQTFEVYSSRLFFLGHLSTSPKNKWRHGKFLHPERIPKSDVVLGKCIYLLSNYGCHFEYPWGEKPENPSIFRKKNSLHTLFFACPTFQPWRCQRRRLAGAFAGQWRAVEIAGCLSEATRGAQWYSLSCRGGCLHTPFFLDPLWKVINYK